MPAAAEEEAPPVASWWAAVGLEGGAFVHRFDGSVSSSEIASPPIDNPQPIRPSDDGASDYVAPFVQGSLELAGPQWAGVRPFVSASVGGEFGVDRDLAKEGTPGTFELSPGFPGASPFTTSGVESTIFGQGSRTSIETGNLFFGAGVGVVFGFEARGRALRVKPSLRYLWEEVEAEGRVQRAVLLQDPNVVTPSGLDDFRLIDLRASETKSFHALGPGLEVDVDLSRKGAWVMSVFASGGVDFFVSDREMAWNATNAQGESASFRVERDPVSYRAGVGLRLRLER